MTRDARWIITLAALLVALDAHYRGERYRTSGWLLRKS